MDNQGYPMLDDMFDDEMYELPEHKIKKFKKEEKYPDKKNKTDKKKLRDAKRFNFEGDY